MLSIIIPTLNAQATLAVTLESVLSPGVPELDVCVIDGGSTDSTRHIAGEGGVRVLESDAGRGRQVKLGADEAKAAWLLFLHADTQLPTDWADMVSRFIAVDVNCQRAGYFKLGFDDASPAAGQIGSATCRERGKLSVVAVEYN